MTMRAGKKKAKKKHKKSFFGFYVKHSPMRKLRLAILNGANYGELIELTKKVRYKVNPIPK